MCQQGRFQTFHLAPAFNLPKMIQRHIIGKNLFFSLKGTVSRDFLSLVFFIKQRLLFPIGMPGNYFEFEVIRIRNRLPSDEYTGESIGIP
jgi:hypothetical protein